MLMMTGKNRTRKHRPTPRLKPNCHPKARSRKRISLFLKGDTHAAHTHRKKDKAARLGLQK